ncbi:hypothetical protein BH11PAT3_BH11PAT3_2500 [soil metagenome]
MTHTALAPSVSTTTLPVVDPNMEAKIDRGIELLVNLPPRRPSGIQEHRERIASFKELQNDFNVTEVEALPMMREVASGKTVGARRCLKDKLVEKAKQLPVS